MHKNDFSKGPVWKCILTQAVPLTIAQLVQLLYNIVDRIYIGHMGDENNIALTGVGLTFPIVTLIMAFTALFGMGGVPLFSIARGRKDTRRAEKIIGNSMGLLIVSALILTLLGYLFYEPVLYAFGASDDSFVYAESYIRIYLIGTVFTMITTGMNGYISAQGFPGLGMVTVIIGAVINIAIDPVFIFLLDMGVAGAAVATIISQIVSVVWVVRILFGAGMEVPLKVKNIKIEWGIAKGIIKLGLSNFVMQGTNCVVQVVCNSTLQSYGGDIYVGIMTVTNSIREIFTLPIGGIVSGSQPVIGYNYGAKAYDRVKSGIMFNSLIGTAYTTFAWILVLIFPGFFFSIFSDDIGMRDIGIEMLHIYFFGFVFMSFQFSGQTIFQAVGDANHAIFFSLLRKVIIVAPLTLILPAVGFGVKGVFLAEPVSNVIGGTACYLTMVRTMRRRLRNSATSAPTQPHNSI